MKNKPILCALISVALTSISTGANSEAWSVATDKNFPPYTYQNDQGIAVGIHYDIVDAAMKNMDQDYKLESYPWARIVDTTDRAEVDFSYSWAGKPARFEKYIMVGPLHRGRNVFAKLSSNTDISYEQYEDLKGLKIGTVRGYAYEAAFDTAEYLTKDSSNTDNAALIKKLMSGRVDIIIGDENVLNAEKKKLGLSTEIVYLPKAVKEVDRYAAFPKTNPEKAKKFANALEAIKADGTYETILAKYR
jgi:polar amino acid transport system substrate-binding protein